MPDTSAPDVIEAHHELRMIKGVEVILEMGNLVRVPAEPSPGPSQCPVTPAPRLVHPLEGDPRRRR